MMHNEIPKESRIASRVILIDQDKRVLYLRASEPKTGHLFWVMPGGGLEPNLDKPEPNRDLQKLKFNYNFRQNNDLKMGKINASD
jgi:ADP-ribose pyrophosphatase YjhB (NUDIX family)